MGQQLLEAETGTMGPGLAVNAATDEATTNHPRQTMDLQSHEQADLQTRTPRHARFFDLKIGDSFDFVGPDPMLVTFHKRCTKISDRKYRDEDGHEHTVGTRAVEVYNVVPATQQPSPRDRFRSTGQVAVVWADAPWPEKDIRDRLVWLSGGNQAIAFDPATGLHWMKQKVDSITHRWSTCRV